MGFPTDWSEGYIERPANLAMELLDDRDGTTAFFRDVAGRSNEYLDRVLRWPSHSAKDSRGMRT